MKKLIIAALLTFALAPLTVASAQAAVGDDPCVTVAKSDAAVALRGPVSSAVASPNGLARVCSFKSGFLSTAQVTAYRYNDVAEAQTQYTALTARMAKIYPGSAPIAGIGDAAIGIRSAVYARKGTAVYRFDVLGPQGPDTLARAKGLAKATMAHVKA